MHPYHIKEFADERVADRLRSAKYRQSLAMARASQPGEPSDGGQPPCGRGFRIPLFNWELRMQAAR